MLMSTETKNSFKFKYANIRPTLFCCAYIGRLKAKVAIFKTAKHQKRW